MEKVFRLRERGTTIRKEVLGGVITFVSMVYILAVNPSILSAAGMDPAAVFTATAISAAAATLFMAFFANYPIALASGMGLNAFFAYSVCIPLAEAGVQNPWEVALAAVLCEGLIFIVLTLCKFREALVNDVPKNLKMGITAGIGLFIALIGFEGSGLVVADPSTVVALGSLASPQAVLFMVGLLLTAVLYHYKVPGYILWGILVTWVLGMIAQLAGWYVVDPEAGVYSLFPDFSNGLGITAPYFMDFDFGYAASHIVDFAIVVFSLLFIDMFDTAGGLIGIAYKGEMLDEDGRLPRANRALMADAVGTVVGACTGTSTVTSYIESATGVAAGARTGLASLVTGLLFLLAIFLSPVFLAIPTFATAPALVLVGILMASAFKEIDFTEDIAASLGAFMAIAMMPFTYSIANGIMFGILAFVIVRVFQGKAKDVAPIMWIAAVLFAIRIATLVI